MCGFGARHFLIFRTEKGEVIMEIKPDYALLFNAVTNAIRKLEPLSEYGPPEIQECIELLKEAQQAAEEINMGEED